MEQENNNIEAPDKSNKNVKMKTIIIALCTVVGFALIAVLGYWCSNRDKSDVNDNIYSTYESVQSGKLQFEVQKFDNQSRVYIWDSDNITYETYETANNFVVITLRVTNTGSKTINFKKSYVKLLSPNYTYNLHELNEKIVGGINIDTSISPSLSKDFKLIFETPDATTQTDYMLYIKGGEKDTWQRILINGEGSGGYY